jgi:hypothetical protein
VNPARKGLGRHRTFRRRLYHRLLTRRVNRRNLRFARHPPSLPERLVSWQHLNCRI